MALSLNSNHICSKLRHNSNAIKHRRIQNSPSSLKTPDCHPSRSAAVDVIILIAVVGALGVLVFPHIKLFYLKFVELFGALLHMTREELSQAPMVYASLGITLLTVTMAALGIVLCYGNKCGKPNCPGLKKAAEFDIQLETEECVKKSSSLTKDDGKKGLFEVPRDYNRELEAELKKIAPPNGRAVLLFRARCGCSVGRLEVPGPKKHRKIKK